MKKGTKATRFTLNFVNKKIVGTQTSFDMASKGSGPVYEELMKLVKNHPDFKFKIKELTQRSDKPKETYKGFNVEFIKDYFSARDEQDGTNYRAELDAALAYAEFEKESRLNEARKTLKQFFDSEESPFNFNDAKKIVRQYRIDHLKNDEGASGSKKEPEADKPDVTELELTNLLEPVHKQAVNE